VQCGDGGVVVTARAGDVIVLPAGTGHKKLSSRGDLGIVGAYPVGQHADMCTPLTAILQRSAAGVARVPLPQSDPVHGKGGPLFSYWIQRGASKSDVHASAISARTAS
jgi:uncharacterized protein YjlB